MVWGGPGTHRCPAGWSCASLLPFLRQPPGSPDHPSAPSLLLGILSALMTLSCAPGEFIETEHRSVTWRHINIVRWSLGCVGNIWSSVTHLKPSVPASAAGRGGQAVVGPCRTPGPFPVPRPAPHCRWRARSTGGGQPCPRRTPGTPEGGFSSWPH